MVEVDAVLTWRDIFDMPLKTLTDYRAIREAKKRLSHSVREAGEHGRVS